MQASKLGRVREAHAATCAPCTASALTRGRPPLLRPGPPQGTLAAATTGRMSTVLRAHKKQLPTPARGQPSVHTHKHPCK